MTLNYENHAENVRFIGILAYPKNLPIPSFSLGGLQKKRNSMYKELFIGFNSKSFLSIQYYF